MPDTQEEDALVWEDLPKALKQRLEDRGPETTRRHIMDDDPRSPDRDAAPQGGEHALVFRIDKDYDQVRGVLCM